MGKGKPPTPPATGGDDEIGKKGTLKVNGSTHQLLHKIAAHRGLTVAELFVEPDLENYLMHMLIEEMRKESERLKAQPPRR